MLNLDTHVLLHALGGKLRPRERSLLEEETWSISAIVIWEIAKLAQLGRIEIDLDDPALSRVLAQIQIWPVSVDVCRTIRSLDFSGDPADEIIAATSLVHGIPLLTRDARLRKSRRVPLQR